MYKKPLYWTDALFLNFLQRVILIHSYLYYEKDHSIWTDRKYDEVAKQLTNIQNKHTTKWIKNKTQYGYCFYDFDGTTGFDLWGRMKEKDKQYISNIAERLVKRDCNIRTEKEALQKLSGIKTNKQKVEHIKVQTRKEKELTADVHKGMY